MSEQMTPERLAEIRERRDQALGMVSALCKPRGTEGSREWIMSIPARPDHDPDLVIGAALEDIDALLAHIDAQAEEIERLRTRLNNTQVVLDDFRGHWPLEYCIGRTYPCEVDGDDLERLDEQMRRNRALLDGEKGGGGA